MTNSFEQLWAATGELLHKVRQYDRYLRFSREIDNLSEMHRMLGILKRLPGSKWLASRGEDKLRRIRLRLVTMMEDLLYTAV